MYVALKDKGANHAKQQKRERKIRGDSNAQRNGWKASKQDSDTNNRSGTRNPDWNDRRGEDGGSRGTERHHKQTKERDTDSQDTKKSDNTDYNDSVMMRHTHTQIYRKRVCYKEIQDSKIDHKSVDDQVAKEVQ